MAQQGSEILMPAKQLYKQIMQEVYLTHSADIDAFLQGIRNDILDDFGYSIKNGLCTSGEIVMNKLYKDDSPVLKCVLFKLEEAGYKYNVKYASRHDEKTQTLVNRCVGIEVSLNGC